MKNPYGVTDTNAAARGEAGTGEALTGPPLMDMHIHSSFSDGTDTPPEILDLVVSTGVRLFSITDHDETAGCEEIVPLLRQVSPDRRPAFVRGIEFSCRDELGRYHILGYGYEPEGGAVTALAERVHGFRMKKLEGRLKYLRETSGVEITEQEEDELRALRNPGKPHLGALLVSKGLSPDLSEAITTYLNPYHEEQGYISPGEAIRNILEDGGMPVLAHPWFGDGGQHFDSNELGARISRLMEMGLGGLECRSPKNTPEQSCMLLDIADREGLAASFGSDYHGSLKPVGLLGHGAVPEDFERVSTERFLEFCRRRALLR